MNAFKSPPTTAPNGPLSLPDRVLHQGLVNFWNRVNFPLKLLELDPHLRRWSPCSAPLLSLLNAYAIGIGRVKGRVWIVAVFLLANMLPQEALIYPLFTMAKAVGLSTTRSGRSSSSSP